MDTPSYTQNGAGPDDEVHLRDIWNLLLRNWLVIGASLVLVVAGVAAYTFTVVPVYQASSSVRIDEEQSNVPVLDILQDLSTGSEVETEMEVLRSRVLAEDVVDSLGLQLRLDEPRGVARVILLDRIVAERWAPAGTFRLLRSGDGFQVADVESGEELGEVTPTIPAALPGATFVVTPAALNESELLVTVRPFDKAVAGLRGTMTVSRPNREANLIRVSYESTDTLLVHQVPNTLTRRFIDRRQTVRKTEARSTVTFLEEQIDTLRRQLATAEEALTDFREEGQVVSLEAEASAQVTQLTELQAQRNTKDAERQALQSLVNEILRESETASPTEPSPFRRLLSFPTLFQNQATSGLLQSLTELEDQRSALLERRTLQDPEVQNLSERIRQQEQQLESIATTYLQGLTNQVESLDGTLQRFGTELERIPAKEVQFARLERQQNVLEDVYTLLQNRLQEARIAQAVEDPSVRVVDPAILPSEPIRPRIVLNLLLAAALGSMLGVGMAFIREYMDDTVHTREDMQEATGGVPVMGMIPSIKESGITATNGEAAEGTGHLEQRLVAGRDPRNPVSEAYRSLRTNLTFSNPDDPPKTVVITSPLPQDGKSTSAANLAITLGQQGIRTLLVDADLRRGVLHSVFGSTKEPGLSTVLAGHATLAETVRTIPVGDAGQIDFLSTGPFPPNPAELLGSQRMRSLVEALEEQYELVILDSAPLTVVTDAAVLGTNSDGVLLVARANVTAKGALAYSVEQLANVRAPILGTVLNDVDFRRDSRYSSSYGQYGYYYHYYYGSDGRKGRKRGRVAEEERSSAGTPA